MEWAPAPARHYCELVRFRRIIDTMSRIHELMTMMWKGEAPRARAVLWAPLFVLSLVHRAILAVRETGYRTGLFRVSQSPIPVISVGNITLGGTGKTTITERLSASLKERGFSPGIVMRGYKKKRPGTFAVDPHQDSAENAGDEAVMLSRRTMLPVIVGKDRAQGIAAGVSKFGIDVAIFDDGFQVRNVRKDVELLVVNGQDGPAALHLFPLGFLREPLEMTQKADIILVNKGELTEPFVSLVASIPVFRVRYRPLHLFNIRRRAMVDYRYLRGERVLAFSGLGDNRSFFSLLNEIGADVVETVEFADHHRYSVDDVRHLQSFDGIGAVVTTEKDAVKIDHMDVGDNVFYLAIEAKIEGEQTFVDLVVEKMRGHRG
jgi:tetraacyldisaccharide 4'-kinase